MPPQPHAHEHTCQHDHDASHLAGAKGSSASVGAVDRATSRPRGAYQAHEQWCGDCQQDGRCDYRGGAGTRQLGGSGSRDDQMVHSCDMGVRKLSGRSGKLSGRRKKGNQVKATVTKEEEVMEKRKSRKIEIQPVVVITGKKMVVKRVLLH